MLTGYDECEEYAAMLLYYPYLLRILPASTTLELLLLDDHPPRSTMKMNHFGCLVASLIHLVVRSEAALLDP